MATTKTTGSDAALTRSGPDRSEIAGSGRHARSRNELEAEQNLIQGNLCTVNGRTTETCDHADLSK
jgi:hypothetical protein